MYELYVARLFYTSSNRVFMLVTIFHLTLYLIASCETFTTIYMFFYENYRSHTCEDGDDPCDPPSTKMRHGIERVVTRKSVLFIYNIYKGVV